jgi:hypothetical protein
MWVRYSINVQHHQVIIPKQEYVEGQFHLSGIHHSEIPAHSAIERIHWLQAWFLTDISHLILKGYIIGSTRA